jgi:hypothetical protein
VAVGVVVVVFVGVRARHGVGGERGKVITAIVRAVTVVWIVARRAVVGVMGCGHAFALDLGGCCGQEVNVKVLAVVGGAAETATVGIEV